MEARRLALAVEAGTCRDSGKGGGSPPGGGPPGREDRRKRRATETEREAGQPPLGAQGRKSDRSKVVITPVKADNTRRVVVRTEVKDTTVMSPVKDPRTPYTATAPSIPPYTTRATTAPLDFMVPRMGWEKPK